MVTLAMTIMTVCVVIIIMVLVMIYDVDPCDNYNRHRFTTAVAQCQTTIIFVLSDTEIPLCCTVYIQTLRKAEIQYKEVTKCIEDSLLHSPLPVGTDQIG
jgi:hypothetical protein